MLPKRFLFVILALFPALASAFITVLPKTASKAPSSAAAIVMSNNQCTTSTTKTTTYRSMAGPAVLEPETIEKKDVEEVTKSESYKKRGGWAVRLFNDPMNKREFVAMCLSKITGLSDGQAYQVMMQAHQNGVSVVGRYDQELAEHYKISLAEHGLLVDMIPVEDD